MKKSIVNILKYLLVALFVSYYSGSTLFIHTHQFTWGSVTHSHPYMPTGSHSHTTTEYQTIEALTNLMFTIVAAVFVAAFFRVVTICYAPPLRGFVRCLVAHCLLRAPPVSLC